MNVIDTKKATKLLRQGKVLIIPTDTVYGLTCIASNAKAAQRVNQIKNRNQPCPVFVSSISQAKRFVKFTKQAERLAKKFWPGALTIILEVKEPYSSLACGSKNQVKTLGVRMADHKAPTDLASKIGEPLLQTSANTHGQPPAKTLNDLDPSIVNQCDGVIKGKCKGLAPSTVVDLTGENPEIIREGPITLKEILQALE